MGALLRSCVEVREPIQLSFGMVGPAIDVLDGGPRASRGRGCFWDFFRHLCPIGLNGQNDVLIVRKCIRIVCEMLTVFAYGQYILGILVSLAFQRYTQV